MCTTYIQELKMAVKGTLCGEVEEGKVNGNQNNSNTVNVSMVIQLRIVMS